MDGAVKRIHSAPAWVSSQNHQRGTSSSLWRRTGVGLTAMFCVSWLAWTPLNLLTRSAASSFLTICLMTPSQFSSLLSGTQVCTILSDMYRYVLISTSKINSLREFVLVFWKITGIFIAQRISELLNSSTWHTLSNVFFQNFNLLE